MIFDEHSDDELPGMWEKADFTGGQTDFPFEQYKPPKTPVMPEVEAEEIAKDLMTALIQMVFERLDADALVGESELASRLNADEAQRISALINTATVSMEFAWE